LISAFSRALADTPKDVFYNVIKDEFTVEDKIHAILHDLLLRPYISLRELFTSSRHKIEIIVSFLAVLELVRMKEITCLQNEAFGDIQIVRNQDNIIPYEGTDQPENN
jgi:segregation and condensation protein A